MFIYLTSSAGYIMLHHFIIFTKRIGCFIMFFFEELKDVECFPRTARAKTNRADHTPRCLGPGLVGRIDLHRAALWLWCSAPSCDSDGRGSPQIF